MRALLVAALLGGGVAWAHEGHLTSIAWDVCARSTLGENCQFDDGVNVSRGTCRSMSDALVCVRNKPLEPVRRPLGTPFAVALGLAGGALGLVAARVWGRCPALRPRAPAAPCATAPRA